LENIRNAKLALICLAWEADKDPLIEASIQILRGPGQKDRSRYQVFLEHFKTRLKYWKRQRAWYYMSAYTNTSDSTSL
jgi:hypothetical protein